MRHFRWILASLALTLFATAVSADSIDFSTYVPPNTTTNISPDYFVVDGTASKTFGAFTVTAWTYSNNKWNQSTLDGRNDATGGVSADNDHGLGVCIQGYLGCTGQGKENINEIDSINGQMEMLQVSLTSGEKTNWNKVVLSSMDQNDKNKFEDYVIANIYAGDDMPSGVSDPSNFASLLCAVNWSSVISGSQCSSPPDHGSYLKYDVPYAFKSPINAKYLYIFAPLRSDTNGDINDFLLRGLDADVPNTQVPEPGSIALLATGLAAASLSIKRKFRG